MDLVNIVNDNICDNNLFNKNDKLLVGVSGGPDSTCLLDILIKLKYNICVAHINHNLRDEAIIEQKYVEEFCKLNNIKCYVLNVDINTLSKENKMGTEEIARNVRYDFFNELLNKYNLDKIVVAHNKDDNLETILQNIIRGCSLKGIAGINFKYGNIVRPLLNIYKSDILNYCKENNVKYFIDKKNKEEIYLINKIRLK
ncbi:MAG: tRNA lysidine(34) synthetase TilS, partial [Clostridia bacterium]